MNTCKEVNFEKIAASVSFPGTKTIVDDLGSLYKNQGKQATIDTKVKKTNRNYFAEQNIQNQGRNKNELLFGYKSAKLEFKPV